MTSSDPAPTTLKEKDAALNKAMGEIVKKHGKGTIVRMKDHDVEPMSCVATGIYGVDYGVLGIGGLPRGRITEIYGQESVGKSSLALMVAGSAQRAGGRAAMIDVEHAFENSW